MTTRLYSVVIDSHDPSELARWWSDTVGWPVTFEEPDEVVVEPDDAEKLGVPALVFVPVPEPKVTKNRVHLDLVSYSEGHQRAIVDRLLASGATEVDVGQRGVPWIVLADPEGNEFCVLEPRDRYVGRGALASIVLDAADPGATARFWSAAAGWQIATEHASGDVSLHHPLDQLPDLDIVAVPDSKTVKNRIHLDVAPYQGDDQAADVDTLIELGARRIDVGQGDDVTWVVLADPEGNELCVLSSRGSPAS